MGDYLQLNQIYPYTSEHNPEEKNVVLLFDRTILNCSHFPWLVQRHFFRAGGFVDGFIGGSRISRTNRSRCRRFRIDDCDLCRKCCLQHDSDSGILCSCHFVYPSGTPDNRCGRRSDFPRRRLVCLLSDPADFLSVSGHHELVDGSCVFVAVRHVRLPAVR